MAAIPRAEYPRPQFVRQTWMNLNGIWEFEMDPGCSGEAPGLPAERFTEKTTQSGAWKQAEARNAFDQALRGFFVFGEYGIIFA